MRLLVISGRAFVLLLLLLPVGLWGQTECETGHGPLDSAAPKTISVADVLQKLGVAEEAAKQARTHYTYKQDVRLQTLNGNDVTGEFHQVTNISYDDKGRRQEAVAFSAQPSLRGIEVTPEDLEDIRTFMPLMLGSDDIAQYTLTYSGQQHVDDLDTYEFNVEPKNKDNGKRYFQGRIWVDAEDFQIVKVCGKSGPEKVQGKKKHEQGQVQPKFVTYRQLVDGHWFPAFTRADDTLEFKGGFVHVRETVKYTDYKRSGG